MTVESFEIPLSPGGGQRFTVPLLGVTYTFELRWCETGGTGWVLDIGDNAGNSLADGIPLVTGCDLLGQLAYLGIGGQLIMQTNSGSDAVPTFDNLGVESKMFFVVVK